MGDLKLDGWREYLHSKYYPRYASPVLRARPFWVFAEFYGGFTVKVEVEWTISLVD